LKTFVRRAGVDTGLVTVFCRHTSASLTIQENADPDVRADLNEFFRRLVPENMGWLRHTIEGPDDMPAHIKAALTDVSLSIPVMAGRMVLGTWQGIYLFEHRAAAPCTPRRFASCFLSGRTICPKTGTFRIVLYGLKPRFHTRQGQHQ
jgi:secondary thiamine-phosphate synthase enzyme